MPTIRIGWLIPREYPEVLEIERHCSNPISSRWSLGKLLNIVNVVGLAARLDRRIAGHAIYAKHSNHFELIRLGVHPAFRRQGVGRHLVAELAGKASRSHRPIGCIRSEVPDDLLEVHLFYRAVGLLAVGVDGPDRDFYRFELPIRSARQLVLEPTIEPEPRP